jgi:hypothetical protein
MLKPVEFVLYDGLEFRVFIFVVKYPCNEVTAKDTENINSCTLKWECIGLYVLDV